MAMDRVSRFRRKKAAGECRTGKAMEQSETLGVIKCVVFDTPDGRRGGIEYHWTGDPEVEGTEARLGIVAGLLMEAAGQLNNTMVDYEGGHSPAQIVDMLREGCLGMIEAKYDNEGVRQSMAHTLNLMMGGNG